MLQNRRAILAVVAALAVILAIPWAAQAFTILDTENIRIQSLITTVDDPANHVVAPGSGYDGVAKIIVSFSSGSYLGSGTLLNQGGKQYLLTAGHVVNVNGELPSFFTAYFPGGQTAAAAAYYFPSGWNGDFANGADLAVVKLTSPLNIQGYDLLRTEISSAATGNMAGYGKAGYGSSGSTIAAGTLRQGDNTFGEANWIYSSGNPFACVFDFDNGQFNQNLFLSGFGIPSDFGLGNAEADIAPGDSGGPTFIGGKLAGVHSFIGSVGPPYDIDNYLNSSFGELGADTRVAAFTGWIDRVTVVPVPGAVYLLISGLGLLVFRRRQ